MNTDFIDMLDGYKAENDELLQKMEDALMEIQEDGMDDENINAVFRAAHTIKGSSGMFGIDYIVDFTHIAENLLDKIRNHKIEINDEIIELLLACKDQMQTLIDFVMSSPEGQPYEEIHSTSQTLINELQVYLNTTANPQTDNEEESAVVSESELNEYRIEIDFGSDTFSHGFDTYTFLNYLQEIGEIKNIQTDTDSIPMFNGIDPTECYMSYIIDIHSDKDSKMLEAAFDFVKDSSTILITDMLADKEESTPKQEIEKVTLIIEEDESVQVKKKTKKSKKNSSAVKQTNFIRIEAGKVDSLINLIGEMVISNAAVMQHAAILRDSELVESVSTVTRMLEEVRENAWLFEWYR